MIPLLYIASPSYSGSTLLTMLLNPHPDLGTVGELKWGDIDLATYQCSCGTLLSECAFWREVGERVRARGLPFNLNRPATSFRFPGNPFANRVAQARLRGRLFELLRSAALAVHPVSAREWPVVQAVNRAVIETTLEIQHARIFADASKDPVRARHMFKTGDYDVRLIQLLRDGRAVMNSAIKNASESPEIAVREWVRTHRQIERLRGELGDERVLRVRYEDLCASPRETLAAIFTFVGLEPQDTTAHFRSTEHHVLGNRMRLRSETAITLDEKWRGTLTADQLRLFERGGLAANAAYGYRD